MISNSADSSGDSGQSDAPNDRTVSAETSRDAARQRRALRRVTRQNAPSWLKKIPWAVFPIYGLMRLHDPNYEEHYEQWEDQQRKDYEGGE